jgi:PKD repeat protein
MQQSLIRLIVALICWLPISALATTQSIHVEWGYTPPSEPTVTGFKLYQEGVFVCQIQDPNASAMDCEVTLTAATTNFTLTASFSDGTESPHSAPFPFTSADTTRSATVVTETNPNGNTLFTFSWEATVDTATLQGYKIYLNNALLCSTNDPASTSISCKGDLVEGTMSFSIAQVATDGTESSLSNLLAYTSESVPTTPPETTPLQAVITAAPLTGTAPVTVEFNATSSTGSISTFQWDYGDGAVATGTSSSHTYTNAGTYTAKLTVTDASGLTNTAQVTVTVSEPVVPASPPTAVISSSTAAGPAPLTVQFDGSGSTAASSATITQYSWSFGDGSSATGATTSHAFTTAGSYGATLTVTDSNGLTSSANTPVVVSEPVAVNVAPTARVNATPVTGTVPLVVTFDASASVDSDGSIASYTWNFGDGGSASGKTVTHTYATAATFTATLQVADDKGATASANTSITAQPVQEQQVTSLDIEMGEVTVTGNWVRVSLSSTFQNPVVIAGPAGFNDAAPGAIRLRNVDSTGFEIKFAEWNYLDGVHPEETVSYLVMEKGRHALADGSMVEAGSFTGTTNPKTVAFSNVFTKTPVVLSTIATANEADAISGRIKAISTAGFSYYFREQEKNQNKHANETVNYIAWEPGKGTIGSLQFEVANTANAVTNGWYNIAYQTSFSQTPLFLADMQTTNNTDTSALRVQQQAVSGLQLKVEEEQSKDSEVTHPAETVGYFALNQPEEKVFTVLTWEFDAAQEANILGFQILANGEQICSTAVPSTRQLTCEMTKPTSPTAFTIRAVEKGGSNSSPSNSITYTP